MTDIDRLIRKNQFQRSPVVNDDTYFNSADAASGDEESTPEGIRRRIGRMMDVLDEFDPDEPKSRKDMHARLLTHGHDTYGAHNGDYGDVGNVEILPDLYPDELVINRRKDPKRPLSTSNVSQIAIPLEQARQIQDDYHNEDSEYIRDLQRVYGRPWGIRNEDEERMWNEGYETAMDLLRKSKKLMSKAEAERWASDFARDYVIKYRSAYRKKPSKPGNPTGKGGARLGSRRGIPRPRNPIR